MYTIGVDAGGTKTLLALFKQDQLIESITLPTCHFMQVGYDGLEETLKKGIQLIIQKYPKINSKNTIISIGMAGYGNDIVIRENIEKAVNKACTPFEYILNNDVAIALAGALNNQDGIVVIAGTGSIVFSKINQQTKRCGGWGQKIGDEGSAFWIGKQVLAMFSKQSDGRLNKGPLYDLIMERCKLNDPYEIIKYTNEHLSNREDLAKLSIIAYEAAKLNDVCALDIFDQAAKELALMINVLIKDFNEQVNVSYIGGVFKSGEYILNPLQKYLDSKAKLIAPIHAPEYGAYLLAKVKNHDNNE